MPTAAPKVCACGKVVPPGGRCPCRAKADAERKARFDKTRPSATARGLGADWRKLRAAHLAAHPRCCRCGAPAAEVDHVVPRREAPDRRLDPTNLQSLCTPCHSGAKQREERRQFGRTPQ
ncbi:HNH endonuclease [Gemmobacter nectariphilus]|uniref:HNH endonuclease n=1 Tax=Gemmobacter nectariphilus TaxID=220343 RepID=UPI0003FF7283|nr:HNH endonuclease signature motif containing protein [Gemmobacter nectariphilus]